MKALSSAEYPNPPSMLDRPWFLVRLDLYSWIQMLISPPPKPEDPSSPPSKKDNFGRLISYMNMKIDIQQPCVAIWSGKRLQVAGIEDDLGGTFREKGESDEVDTKGVLLLMDEVEYQNVKEVLEPRDLCGMTPLKWRTVSNQQDFGEVSMQLMNYTLCHKSMCWWTLSEREESDASFDEDKDNEYVSTVFLDASKYVQLLERLYKGIQRGKSTGEE